MKKRLTLFFAAALICGATMLTSCAKEDNPSGQADTREYVEDFPKASTTDQLTTTIQRPAYVFDATYTGEGKAVVARATKKVAFTKII